jgi:hypothetical protein
VEQTCFGGIPAAVVATVLFQHKQKLNQTKQIRKYAFMENIFYHKGLNSHSEGMRHSYIRSPDGLVVGLAPVTLEFWFGFPNERNQGKQGATLC